MNGASSKIIKFVPLAAAARTQGNVYDQGQAELLYFSEPKTVNSQPVRVTVQANGSHFKSQNRPKEFSDPAIKFASSSVLRRSVLTFPKNEVISERQEIQDPQQVHHHVPVPRVNFTREELLRHRNEIYSVHLMHDNTEAVRHSADKISYYARIDQPLIRAELLKQHYNLMKSLLPHVEDAFYDINGDYFDKLTQYKIEIPYLRAFLHLMNISSHQAIKRHIWTTVPRLYLWANWFSNDDPTYAHDLQKMLRDHFEYYLR